MTQSAGAIPAIGSAAAPAFSKHSQSPKAALPARAKALFEDLGLANEDEGKM